MSKFSFTTNQDRIIYWCQGCKHHHGIPIGLVKEPKAWLWNGSIESPTLSPSILNNPGKEVAYMELCHHHITDGKIVFSSDCSHEFAGQTLEVEDLDTLSH